MLSSRNTNEMKGDKCLVELSSVSAKYFCPYCGMQFPTEFCQDKHVFTHENEARGSSEHSCSQCEATFYNVTAFLYHTKSAHDREEDQKGLVCFSENEWGDEVRAIELNKLLEAVMIDLPADQKNLLDHNISLNKHECSVDPLQMALQLNEELQNSCKICLISLSKRKKTNFERQKRCQETLIFLIQLENLKEIDIIRLFGIPYFKDQVYSSKKQVFNVPELNKEAIMARELGVHLLVFSKPKIKEKDQIKLRNAVRKQLVLLKFEKCRAERSRLEEALKDQKKEGLCTIATEKQLAEVHRLVYKLSDLDNVDHDQLFYDQSIHRAELVNWGQIAAEYFPLSNYDADDLRFSWERNLRPDTKAVKLEKLNKPVLKSKNSSPKLKPSLKMGQKWKKVSRCGRFKRRISLESELRDIIRPLEVIKNHRPRITSYPGDGREHGIIVYSIYRVLGGYFDRRKTPSSESPNEKLLAAGIQPPDFDSFRTMMALIEELPTGHSKLESSNFLSEDHPPSVSLLPPTLHSLTGLRGLFLYRDSLRNQVQAGAFIDEEMKYVSELPGSVNNDAGCQSDDEWSHEDILDLQSFGDPSADRRIYYLLLSIFYWTGLLVQHPSLNVNNPAPCSCEICKNQNLFP